MTVTLDEPRQSSSLPKPVDDEVALLLQTVWDLLSGGDHWPPYRTVDRLLYRERRMSVDEVIARTPTVLLLGGRPEGGASPRPDGQLSLTVAGAAASAGSELALAVFLATVRLAAEAELQPVPNGEDPTVTFDDAAAAANGALAPEVAARVARQSGLLLHPEPWTGHVLLYQSGWRVAVDRRVRPYAGVADLGAYWRIREQQRGASTAQEEPPTRGVTATTGSGGRVIELARRWKIGERLGSGGFGTVYRAAGEDGTQAAAKLVPKVPGADREMLFAELGGVRNVVPIIDSGETEEAWVLVMPLAERSLQDHLAASGPLPVAEALVVLRDVAAALADLAARAARVVHRDIKPANVLLLGRCVVLGRLRHLPVRGGFHRTGHAQVLHVPAVRCARALARRARHRGGRRIRRWGHGARVALRSQAVPRPGSRGLPGAAPARRIAASGGRSAAAGRAH